MKPARRSRCWSLLAIVAAAGCSSVNADDLQLEQSRSLVQSFGTQLKAELKSGLEAGGPVPSVDVCKEVAPGIASKISRQSGAKVARTSLRYRNPGNAPEPWQARVLTDFEEQAASADTSAPLEYFVREDDGTVRYMLAIRTDGVCLACHGEAVSPQLMQVLKIEYPYDRATGFAPGDIRGAFTVTWPPPDTHPGS